MSRILPSKRSVILYLEHARVHLDEERVVYAVAEGARTREWPIPVVNCPVLVLGIGTSITQGAVRRLAEEKVMVGWVGNGGSPLLMGSMSEYAANDRLQRWISVWPDPARRLIGAKRLALLRCAVIRRLWPTFSKDLETWPADVFEKAVPLAASVEELRGLEGNMAKSLYVACSRAYGVQWSGRSAGVEDGDRANRFLDHGNYIAYGSAAVVLWTHGIPPGLAVNHGVTRAGALVFDLADVVKDAVIMPCAFRAVSAGWGSREFRESVIDALDHHSVLQILFDAFDGALGSMETCSP